VMSGISAPNSFRRKRVSVSILVTIAMWYKSDPAIPGSALFPPETPRKTSENKRFAKPKSFLSIASGILFSFSRLSRNKRAHLWQCPSSNFVTATTNSETYVQFGKIVNGFRSKICIHSEKGRIQRQADKLLNPRGQEGTQP
jgi:hypothetical protein